ncbi:MAG: hypothetical protein JOZ40_13470 [Methylobacteriaceae bacterium]|nr:hypothetical protein [Methylobacteriaceae bacterium]
MPVAQRRRAQSIDLGTRVCYGGRWCRLARPRTEVLRDSMRSQLIVLLLVATAAEPAAAQLVLPGAATPSPVGTKHRPHTAGLGAVDASGKPLPKIMPIRVPSDDTLIGRPLWLNGATGQITFARKDKALVVAGLQLSGDKTSKPGEACKVDVKPPVPMSLKPLGNPAGVARYQLDLDTCPFTFDVLDGAILVPKETQACAFKADDCQVNPAGLWGPAGADFGADKIKDIERGRAGAEAAERDAFRALEARTSDKAEIKKIAADQAAFSSEREETCRSYARESQHGFCATRFTEARVAAMQAALNATVPVAPAKKRVSSKTGKRSATE